MTIYDFTHIYIPPSNQSTYRRCLEDESDGLEQHLSGVGVIVSHACVGFHNRPAGDWVTWKSLASQPCNAREYPCCVAHWRQNISLNKQEVSSECSPKLCPRDSMKSVHRTLDHIILD